MVSIIITTYNEYKTLPRAIQSVLECLKPCVKHKEKFEILVIGPDKKTKEIVESFSFSFTKFTEDRKIEIRYIKDKGEGKPAAINLAFKYAIGDIFILTDGDVYLDKKSIQNILLPFKEKSIGAVSGNPVSINSRKTLFGYWSHFLTYAAHQMRISKKKRYPCSGYLYGFRNLIKHIPENIFSEDSVITQMIRDKGLKIAYASNAMVYVKYPDNFKDWSKQKIRSTGGYIQKQSGGERSFKQEIKGGIKLIFVYPNNLKEFFWTVLLYLARIYIWFMIFWKIKIKKKKFFDIWQRVESTK